MIGVDKTRITEVVSQREQVQTLEHWGLAKTVETLELAPFGNILNPAKKNKNFLNGNSSVFLTVRVSKQHSQPPG